MIIVRAPLRVSFLGGGTDYPEFETRFGIPGCVVGTSIDKYVYVSVLPQPYFEEVRYRFTYRITEQVQKIEEIMHPVVRSTLIDLGWDKPINLATMADLPGRSGLGSSSSFTVALLHALNTFLGNIQNPKELAKCAIRIERNLLNEAGGMQDQFHSSIGGLRGYTFSREDVEFSDPLGTQEFRDILSDCLYLVAIGKTRDSAPYAKLLESKYQQIESEEYFVRLASIASEFMKRVSDLNPYDAFELLGESLRESWAMKKLISDDGIKNASELVDFGISRGAIAGKLCGAGGTGFAAFLVPANSKRMFESSFDRSDLVKCATEKLGVSQHVF